VFRKLVLILSVGLLLVSCASKRKVLKEIDKDSPHEGHLYKLDNYVIEVAEVPTHLVNFYFYTLDESGNLAPASIKDIELKNGLIDPHDTKQNYSIIFIPKKTYIEGVLEKYEVHKDDDLVISVDVKIGDKKRNIKIPFHHEE
jgi:hypothetical protein